MLKRAQSRVLSTVCGTRAPGCDWPARGRGWTACAQVPAGVVPGAAAVRRARAGGGRRQAPEKARTRSIPGRRPHRSPLACALPLPAPPGPRHGERAPRWWSTASATSSRCASISWSGTQRQGALEPAQVLSAPGAPPPLPPPGASPPGPSRRGSCGVKASPLRRVPTVSPGNFRPAPRGDPLKFPTLATCRWSEGSVPSASPCKDPSPVMRSTCLRTASLFSILLLLCDKGDEFVGTWGRKRKEANTEG